MQNFQLHRPHQLYPQFPQAGVPVHMQLGFFFFQLAELLQCFHGIVTHRQNHPVGENRLQRRGVALFFCTKTKSGGGAGQAHSGHNVTGQGFVHSFVFCAGVHPQLGDLFFPVGAFQGIAYAQGTAGWDAVQTAFVDGWAAEKAAAR